MRRWGLIALAWLVLAAAAMTGISTAAAGTRHDNVVSDDPVDITPHVLDGIVLSIVPVGDTMVVGGDFRRVSQADGSGAITQPYLFAFDRRTGRIDRSFRPHLDGAVLALAAGPGATVYAGGRFSSVNRASQPGLVRLGVDDGVRTGSGAGMAVSGGEVRALAAHGRHLYVGGSFTGIGGQARTALARLDTRTGAVDAGFDIKLSGIGSRRPNLGSLALSPGGGRLVIAGAITSVSGRARHQIAMIDTSGPPRLYGWSTDVYRGSCDRRFDTYLRGIDFSPDGSYFVVTTTGGHSRSRAMCNTAARFETRSGAARPTWVNHTGGDSLYSVAVTAAAVYVGGHQRWLDNPYGDGYAGPGAVARTGIGAIDPDSGKALAWNPTRTRGIGAKALVATPEGLWVGSDTDRLGHEYHARIGMFPL